MTNSRLQTAAVFCIAFVIIGWSLPIAFAMYAPSGHYINNVDVRAGNTTIDADSHNLCFTRDVRHGTEGVLISKMVLIQEDHRKEVQQEAYETYFHPGNTTVELSTELPDDLEPGDYRYLLSISYEVRNGLIEREMTVKSNTFTISENGTTEDIDCSNMDRE